MTSKTIGFFKMTKLLIAVKEMSMEFISWGPQDMYHEDEEVKKLPQDIHDPLPLEHPSNQESLISCLQFFDTGCW